METVIILGTGCAGLTAAIYAARAHLNPLVIEGIQPGGQLTTTSDVENFPGFPEGINGFELVNRMREQATRFGARFISDTIINIEISGTTKKLYGKGSTTYNTKGLIISTGAQPRLLDVPGEQTYWGGKGVTTCATCDGAFYADQEVVVVGGGDSACEEALFLTRFCSKVTLVHRRDSLRASPIMAKRVLEHEKIVPVWNSGVESITGGSDGLVDGIVLKNLQTQEISKLQCKGVFIAIGHIPNTRSFKDIIKLDTAGYIIPEPGSMVRTSVEGIYVAGDCVDHVYRQAITAAGMGCQASMELERWLSEH